MSDSVPSRTDTVVPDPQAPDIDQPAGSMATTPDSQMESVELIERMSERLRFYESFDALIQQNIARSGQLMREAGEKRDEAVATIAQSRRQIETERETQRSALTELLDDVMTIQQATERLAHRVSDALEQIEFDLEPIGLHDAGVLGSQQSGRLPAGFSSRADAYRSVAEDVHDEYRHGVLGQPEIGGAPATTEPVTDGTESIGLGRVVSHREIEPDQTTADASAFDSHGIMGNPENAGIVADQVSERDADETGGHATDEREMHEAEPGQGSEAAPVESSAETWTPDSTMATGPDDEDLTSVVEPYTEAHVAPHAEQAEPGGDTSSPDSQIASETSDAAVGADDASADVSLSDSDYDDIPLEVGSAFGPSTEPASENLTSPDDAPIESPMETSIDVTSNLDDATGEASLETGVDAEIVVVAADGADLAPETTSVLAGNEHATHGTAPTASESNLAASAAEAATRAAQPPDTSPAADPVMAPAEPAREQQTTVVLDGVPRAAVALAIQRHILSRPEVLRAEVREYYDHRLTLFVTGRRATTADDLQDWDGSATWEQIRSSPELIELRMVM